jgi:hypothetical protein
MRVEGTTVKRIQHGQRLRNIWRVESFPTDQGHHTYCIAFINNWTLDVILQVTHVDLECRMVRQARIHICDVKLDKFQAIGI